MFEQIESVSQRLPLFSSRTSDEQTRTRAIELPKGVNDDRRLDVKSVHCRKKRPLVQNDLERPAKSHQVDAHAHVRGRSAPACGTCCVYDHDECAYRSF